MCCLICNKTLSKILALLVILGIYSVSQTHVNGEKQISAKELEAIEKFRPMVEEDLYRDYMHTNKYLVKWIRSTKMNLERAKTKLNNAHAWRRENGVDGILRENFSKIQQRCPTYTNIVDRTGRPVFAVSVGKCDGRKLALSAPRKENQRYLMWILESLTSQLYLNKTSEEVSTCGVVADLSGFNLRQHGCLSCFPFYVDFVLFYEAYYPETAGYVISINTPRIVVTTFTSLLAPFASEATVLTLQPYGFDKDEWSKELTKIIPENQLIAEFGGTRRSFND